MIVFSEHALERMEERGADRREVRQTVREGEDWIIVTVITRYY